MLWKREHFITFDVLYDLTLVHLCIKYEYSDTIQAKQVSNPKADLNFLLAPKELIPVLSLSSQQALAYGRYYAFTIMTISKNSKKLKEQVCVVYAGHEEPRGCESHQPHRRRTRSRRVFGKGGFSQNEQKQHFLLDHSL